MAEDIFISIFVLAVPNVFFNALFLYVLTSKPHLRTLPNMYISVLLIVNLCWIFITLINAIVVTSGGNQSPEAISFFKFVNEFIVLFSLGLLCSLARERYKYHVMNSSYLPAVYSSRKKIGSAAFGSVIYSTISILVSLLVKKGSDDSSDICHYSPVLAALHLLELILLHIVLLIYLSTQYLKTIIKLKRFPYPNILIHQKRKKSVFMLFGISLSKWCLLTSLTVLKIVTHISSNDSKLCLALSFANQLLQILCAGVLPFVYLFCSEQIKVEYKLIIVKCRSTQVEPSPEIVCEPNTLYVPTEDMRIPSDESE